MDASGTASPPSGRSGRASADADLRRRRTRAGVVLVIGSAVLAWSLRVPAGDPLFYPATLVLASVWILGGVWARRGGSDVAPVALRSGGLALAGRGVVVGLFLLLVFLLGAIAVAQVPLLAEPVQRLLDHARQGSLPVVAVLTLVNGLGEELFFRGALFSVLPKRWRVLGTTATYAAVTALAGLPLLVLAAIVLGLITALQRRATASLAAPVATHLIWSLGMLVLLGPTLSVAARWLG